MTQILYAFHFSYMCGTSHVTNIHNDFITLVIIYEAPRFAIFFSLLLLFSTVGTNFPLSILFPIKHSLTNVFNYKKPDSRFIKCESILTCVRINLCDILQAIMNASLKICVSNKLQLAVQ